MKKITIACLTAEKQATVERLEALGTLHIVPLAQPVSEALDSLHRKQERLARVLSAMKSAADIVQVNKCDSLGAEQALEDASRTLDAMKRNTEELAQIRKNSELLRPWGAFSRKTISDLRERGIFIELCAGSPSHLPELPKGAVLKVISIDKGISYFAVISTTSLEDINLPLATLPADTDLHKLEEQETAVLEDNSRLQTHFAELASLYRNDLTEYTCRLEEEIAFAKARDGMSASKSLSFLRGYVPSDKVDPLRIAARENSWAIRYEEVPENDTDVPTSLKIPKAFQMAKSIFDFVGILPGYRETDVSISMLVFLSIFCGMLVGDAGYGLLFTLAVLWLRKKNKDEAQRESLNLLLIMSLCILGYGAICCNWFAIPPNIMPSWMKPFPFLCDETSQKNVQLICFFLGAFHMSMARVWRALKALLRINPQVDDSCAFVKKLREALGHVGWGVFLWANFGMTRLLIVTGGGVGDLEAPFVWCYIIGFIMILAFSIDWTDMGTVIYMPFSFINCFVDVLSYIRLFAVGLSSMYIADSFNGMAMSLNQSISAWSILTIPAGLLILLLGHLLNIALACMGVLVHGIRLNTLEFSGHMDLSWSGKAYKPLRRN